MKQLKKEIIVTTVRLAIRQKHKGNCFTKALILSFFHYLIL